MRGSLQRSDVAVAGGGFIGLASALRLQQAGAEVVVIDPEIAEDAASFGNAGQIAAEIVEPLACWRTVRNAPSHLWSVGGPLAFHPPSARDWLAWSLRFLHACTGARPTAGRIALGALQAMALPAWRRLAADIGAPELLTACDQYVIGRKSTPPAVELPQGVTQHMLDPDQTSRLAALIRTDGAVGYAVSGVARLNCPAAALARLAEALQAAGGKRMRDRVASIEPRAGAARLVLASGRTLDADRVLVAAGARSAHLLRPLGAIVPLIAERGYHLHYTDHGWPRDAPTVVLEDEGALVTVFDSGLRTTGFTELARPGAAPDPAKWRRLEQIIARRAVPVRGSPRRWCGERPTLPDFLPAIGILRDSRRVLYAFGHQHLGVTLAPATAELMADLVSARPHPVLTALDLERFAHSRAAPS